MHKSKLPFPVPPLPEFNTAHLLPQHIMTDPPEAIRGKEGPEDMNSPDQSGRTYHILRPATVEKDKV